MIRALLVVNPTSGGRRWLHSSKPSWRLRAVLDRLHESGYDVRLEVTVRAGHGEELARGATEPCVFALGGDGTVREVAAGLLGSDRALGILPGGTTNVLARHLSLSKSALEAAARYRLVQSRPRVRPIDVGVCGTKPFLMMASRGLDADTLHRLRPALKARFGRAAIVAQGLRSWLAPRKTFAIDCADQAIEVSFAAICNIPLYGGSFVMAPAASWHDGSLDLVAHTSTSRAAAAVFGLSVLRQRHLRRRDVVVRQHDSFRFTGKGDALIQLDGDPHTVTLPVDIRVSRKNLALLHPAAA